MKYYLLNPYIRRVVLAVLADALCFVAAASVSWFMLEPTISVLSYAGGTLLGAFLCFVALYYCDAYSPGVLGSGRRTVASIVNAMGLAFVAALAVYFLISTPEGGVEALANIAALYFPFLLGARILFRLVSSLPQLSSRVLVIGASDLGVSLADAIRERRNLGLELCGFLTDDEDLIHNGYSISGYPILGRVHEIEKVVEKYQVSWVVVASKDRSEYFPAQELLRAKLYGCRVESGIAFYERVTGRIYLRDLRPSYLVFSEGFRMNGFSRFMKRAMDVVGSLAVLTLLSPVLVIAAIAIKLDSRGPVLYRQDRVGQGGEVFGVIKLRSMYTNAEQENGPQFTTDGDRRITRVGSLLRRTRLDEIPQLINVLRGEMSLVGPRPERPAFVEQLSNQYPLFAYRCAIKPGCTGWAQIRYGYVNNVSGFEQKLALDLYYMKYRSVKMDLMILWHTVKTVLLMKGV